LMKKVGCFIAFDFPLDRDYISEQFAATNVLHLKKILNGVRMLPGIR